MQNEVFALEGRDLISRRRCSGYPQHSNSIRATPNQREARDLGNESSQALGAQRNSFLSRSFWVRETDCCFSDSFIATLMLLFLTPHPDRS